MMSLIMLGIIPGTNIQITFETWLAAMALIAAVVTVILTHRYWVALLLALGRLARQAAQNMRATTARPA